ncbi:MAG: rubrerythrin [Actinobacteria bacterium]|nr:rubrerythrin [Actinomycetota bacterium]
MQYGKNIILVCKACGYKIRAENLKTVCPACGVDKKFFEQFTDKIPPKRRKLLELHLHPVTVHFSVAISVFILAIIIISLFTGGKIAELLNSAIVAMSVALPFFVTGGLISGIFDGILRFKKIKRPALLSKIYISIIFLMAAVAMPVIALTYGLSPFNIKIIILLLSIISAGCGVLLGKLGGHLTEAILPGK